MYSSQRHHQGSRRSLEDILVSCDGYHRAGNSNNLSWRDKRVFELKPVSNPIIFETVSPIPPPLGTSSGNPSSSNVNRVDMMPTTTDPINATTITNLSQSVVDENLPQLFDSRGGSHVTNVSAFDKEDFTSWKVRFLVFLDGLEPYLLKTLEDGPFVPMSSLSTSENLLPKRQNRWSNAESRLANQDCESLKE
ncbi:hypothetical protein Tco_1398628 [Tanacetum coccineum]